MKIRVPDYFKDFKCIASECEDTCCAGWGIVIDDETHQRYKKVNGTFGERLRSEIVSEGGENIFVLKGNNCPFLNKDKLCDIYSNLGEEGLCYTCKQYPRFTEEFGSLKEIGISLSCPEAARIILRKYNEVKFELTENDDVVSSYNDINATLYLELQQSRKAIMDVLQRRDVDIKYRAAMILDFAEQIQKKIDESKIKAIKEIRDKFINDYIKEDKSQDYIKYNGQEHEKYNLVYEYFKVFKKLKHINPNDPLGLEDGFRYFWNSMDDEYLYISKNKDFNEYYKEKQYKFENILVYFIYRYFMKAVFDYDVIAKVKTAIISYIMIKELAVIKWLEEGELKDEDIENISQRYSKDIEHLEENIDNLAEIFELETAFRVENIKVVIMN